MVDLIVEKDKTYDAVLKLGIITDTQDMTGNVIRTSEVDISLDRSGGCPKLHRRI